MVLKQPFLHLTLLVHLLPPLVYLRSSSQSPYIYLTPLRGDVAGWLVSGCANGQVRGFRVSKQTCLGDLKMVNTHSSPLKPNIIKCSIIWDPKTH